MNKVIQIQLGGMFFTLEDSAFDRLKNYLDQLKTHFGNNPESDEIMEDIEVRIAELLNKKLGNESRTVLEHDIIEIIRIMGDAGQFHSESSQSTTSSNNDSTNAQKQRPTRLRRDPFNQSLGGVCAGIARYLDIDPTLIRIAFVLGLVVYGSGILLYLILWLVIPEAVGDEANLYRPLENTVRRLYRDPDQKVIGGVCGGLASYFGLDVIWIRIAFVAGVFIFGTGMILYLVLWIVIPKATTTAQKLQMRGEVADIHSIGREIKNNFQKQSDRFTEDFQRNRSQSGHILVSIFRFILGGMILLILIGLSSLLFITFPQFLNNNPFIMHFPAMISDDPVIATCLKTGLVLIIAVPLLSMLFTAIRLLFDIRIDGKSIGISMSSFFVLGLILLGYSAYSIKTNMRSSADEVRSLTTFTGDTLCVLDFDTIENPNRIIIQDEEIQLAQNSWDIPIESLRIRKSNSDTSYIQIRITAHGKSKSEAFKKAKQTPYSWQKDSNTIRLSTYFHLREGQSFRNQNGQIRILLPVGKTIILPSYWIDLLDENTDYSTDDCDLVYLMMTENGLRVTKTVKNKTTDSEKEEEWNDESDTTNASNDSNDTFDIRIRKDKSGKIEIRKNA